MIDWFLFSCSSRNIEQKDFMTIKFSIHYIIVTQEIQIDNISIVYTTPELLFILINQFVCQGINVKFSFFLFNAKNNGSSIGVCKRRICFPKSFWKSTSCRFEFNFGRLFLLHQFFNKRRYV